MKPCVIIVNGYPGVGKHTVAKSIHAELGSTCILIHNHLLIDPVVAICPHRTAAHYALHKKFRDTAFNALVADPKPERTIILTTCLGQSPQDIETMLEHLRIAQERRVPAFLINLTCEPAEHSNRIGSEERKNSGTSKCTDPRVLDELNKKPENALFNPVNVSGEIQDLSMGFSVEDTSGRSPDECAQSVIQAINTHLLS